jgi:AcrR family transcriptional regulator
MYVGERPTQADRSARTRGALLESAARHLSRHGYGNLVLEQVAADAGYTRGALYHQFRDKQDLVLAVLEWVDASWREEVGRRLERESDPVAELITMARVHAVYCRRDVARVAMALRLEFAARDHPVGRAIKQTSKKLQRRSVALIEQGRKEGSLPAGPAAKLVAAAYWGALEGVVISLAARPPHDVELAERTVAGVLGISPGA